MMKPSDDLVGEQLRGATTFRVHPRDRVSVSDYVPRIAEVDIIQNPSDERVSIRTPKRCWKFDIVDADGMMLQYRSVEAWKMKGEMPRAPPEWAVRILNDFGLSVKCESSCE